MSYHYIRSEPGLWTVGVETATGWTPESDHASPDEAAARVHYLNGGDASLRAELAEANRAFEELARAARRLLYDISLEDHPMPDSAAALADLVFERDAPTDETADAAGEER